MWLKKYVVIGPESTGKSTLCQELATAYSTSWVPEYAREYLLTHGKSYQYEDLITISKGQLALEDQYSREAVEKNSAYLFIDTDMYVMKVWSEFVYGKCDPWILHQIATRQYDGYLLCQTDLPWAPDELREYPDLVTREKLYHIYKDALVNQSTPWVEINGLSDQRTQKAIEVIEHWNH
jgi:NadR type nicotinamide-nucleotide adenylyltransferase